MTSKYGLADIDIEELISDSHLLKCLLDHSVQDWKGYDSAWETFNDSYHAVHDSNKIKEYPEFVEGNL